MNILDHLYEAIAVYRSLRKASTTKAIHFQAGLGLLQSVIVRWNVSRLQKDVEEAMQPFPEIANDGAAIFPFENFLKPLSYDVFNLRAAHGPTTSPNFLHT